MIGGKKGDFPSIVGSKGSSGDTKSILGEGSDFEGKLKFEGTVRVDGRFKGEIQSSGTLIVGEKAVVEGDVFVDSSKISGKIKGSITAKTRLELHAPAVVHGNIEAPVIVIEEGVSFDGKCHTSSTSSQASVSSVPASKGGQNAVQSTPKQPELIKK